MPYRQTPLTTGEIYHVFNRSTAKTEIFVKDEDCQRALECLHFYHFHNPGLKFSYFNRLSEVAQKGYLESLRKSKTKIEIYAFAMMPNHFHFLIRQQIDGGLTKFMRQFQDSFAKYFNVKYSRSGALFQSMFKAVRVESEAQFLHISRYIHLNPLTSFVLKKFPELRHYYLNSYVDYCGPLIHPFMTTDYLLSFFKVFKIFEEFHVNQVDYQRSLHNIDHLTIDHTSHTRCVIYKHPTQGVILTRFAKSADIITAVTALDKEE